MNHSDRFIGSKGWTNVPVTRISMNLVPMNLVSSRQLFYRLTYYFLNNSNALSSSSITRWYSLDSSSSHTHSLLLINLLFPFFPRSYKINATKRIYGRKEDSGQGWRWQGYTENMAAPRVCGVWRYCEEIHQEARVSVSVFQCFSVSVFQYCVAFAMNPFYAIE